MDITRYIKNEATKLHLNSFELASVKASTFEQKVSLIALKTILIIKAALIDYAQLLVVLKNKVTKNHTTDSEDITFIFKKTFNHLFNASNSLVSSSLKHKTLKAALKALLEQKIIPADPFNFSEKELADSLNSKMINFPVFSIDGPDLLAKLASRGNTTTQKIYDLDICHQTTIDLLRTPVSLTQKNGRLHDLGSLRPRLALDAQVRELKTRTLHSLGETPQTLKITEMAINCIHQEQIKPLLFYVQGLLPSNLHLQAKKTGRLFSIIINQDNTISISERITMCFLEEAAKKEQNESAPDLNPHTAEFDLSYSYKITQEGNIENTTYKTCIKSA